MNYTCNNSPEYGCHTEKGRAEATRLGGCELHPQPESVSPAPAHTNRHGERCSKECGEGRHQDCTETFETCNCTYRGLHVTSHRYATVSPAPAQAERPICQSCEETIHLREDGEWAHEDNAMECFIGPHSPKAWPLRFRRGVAYERPAAPAQEVKRYGNFDASVDANSKVLKLIVHESIDGRYVLYSDYASLSAELERVKQERDHYADVSSFKEQEAIGETLRCQKAEKDNERLSEHVSQLAFELGCKENESNRHSHGRCLVAGIRKLEQAAVDQYNAGRASLAGELDVATRATSDAHNIADQEMQKRLAVESQLSAAREALEKLVVKFEAVTAAVDPYIALQAIRSGNPKLYQGPTCEPELTDAKKLLAALNGGK